MLVTLWCQEQPGSTPHLRVSSKMFSHGPPLFEQETEREAPDLVKMKGPRLTLRIESEPFFWSLFYKNTPNTKWLAANVSPQDPGFFLLLCTFSPASSSPRPATSVCQHPALWLHWQFLGVQQLLYNSLAFNHAFFSFGVELPYIAEILEALCARDKKRNSYLKCN